MIVYIVIYEFHNEDGYAHSRVAGVFFNHADAMKEVETMRNCRGAYQNVRIQTEEVQ